jgi:hypothetical protein
MYTLRIIERSRKSIEDDFDEATDNYSLGDAYSVLLKGKTREFKEQLDHQYPGMPIDHIIGLVAADTGDIWFIEEDTDLVTRRYFIMTDSGQTFERL